MTQGRAEADRVVSVSRVIAAPASVLFELIADPAQQPRWDANDNLAEAADGQRVRGVGDVFRTRLTIDSVRENHVVAFEQGREIAWKPAEEGTHPPGHIWALSLEPVDEHRTRVIHTYDWTDMRDPHRVSTAQGVTADSLRASLDRLASLVEEGEG
ncbi:SRPBCC family protein [Brachybacterium sp. GCM10030267]|uniref:SRPBCC family protein n=1 Tax=Brachybacterium sp. GCM10030267 TaxID=3273381 RepID=UPI003622CD0E